MTRETPKERVKRTLTDLTHEITFVTPHAKTIVFADWADAVIEDVLKDVIVEYQEYQRMLSLTGVKKSHYEAQVGRIMDALAAAMPDREVQEIDED